jgi:hypothetical protein
MISLGGVYLSNYYIGPFIYSHYHSVMPYINDFWIFNLLNENDLKLMIRFCCKVPVSDFRVNNLELQQRLYNLYFHNSLLTFDQFQACYHIIFKELTVLRTIYRN